MQKKAIDTKNALKWLLGTALLGASARTGVSLAHSLGAAPSVNVREQTDLYDPQVDIPVEMSPEQYARYQSLQSPKGKAKAAAWDSTVDTLAGVAGGYAGWNLVDSIIKRRRKQQLDGQLKQLHQELSAIQGDETVADPMDPYATKMAAAWDMLEIAAERHVRFKADPTVKIAVNALQAATGAAKGIGKAIGDVDPMTKMLVGGGAALGATPFIPGVRSAFDAVGKGTVGAAANLGKTVGKPLATGLVATLGPIAALSLLYGLSRGYSATKDRDPRIADLKEIRKQIRKQEIEEQPYFRLCPVLKGQS